MPGVHLGPMVVVIQIGQKVVQQPTWEELEWEEEEEVDEEDESDDSIAYTGQAGTMCINLQGLSFRKKPSLDSYLNNFNCTLLIVHMKKMRCTLTQSSLLPQPQQCRARSWMSQTQKYPKRLRFLHK